MPTEIPGPRVQREKVTASELAQLGVELDQDFPGSTVDDFRRYPVLSEGGWFTVVKHMPSLRSVARTPGPLLGPVALACAGLDLE